MRSACKVTSIFMKRAIEMLSGTIDDDKKMTHEKLAEDIDNIINDAKVWKEHRALLQNVIVTIIVYGACQIICLIRNKCNMFTLFVVD